MPESNALTWDALGERLYETGVDKGVLFPFTGVGYGAGVAWNGLVSVKEKAKGGEFKALYADNIKYLNLLSAEEFEATIEAFMYPDEFAVCDGSAAIAKGVHAQQQTRKPFGFSYRTKIGNDVDGVDHGYKIHLVYGAMAAPSERNRQTINNDPDAATMSWEISTTPVDVPGDFRPTAHIVIDSTACVKEELEAFEKVLYGDVAPSKLPTPTELLQIFTTGVGA